MRWRQCWLVPVHDAAGTWRPRRALHRMSASDIAKPIARAINIYRSMTRHDLDRGAQRDVARHIRTVAQQGTHDPARLTVHGLSYLQDRERKLREPKA